MHRYWSKLPRQPFMSPKRGWTTDPARKARQIEERYAAGYTAEPYVHVIAEWMPGRGWTNPLAAAGLAPTP